MNLGGRCRHVGNGGVMIEEINDVRQILAHSGRREPWPVLKLFRLPGKV